MAKQAVLIVAAIVMLCLSKAMAEEELDLEFLEWLGQTTEIEELGVDVDEWLLSRQQSAESAEAAEKTQ